ncbi:DNA topoisomerase 2 [Phlyctema vagabunda]|uniref:DNA topoisomerase (ATP-hydrolyzing) n=1 Tax=Phlyctema vagabunda TaxID=108571 RepID=A0ABR4PCN9_9HELO
MKPEEEEMIDLAFSKKKADARKQWLGNFIPGTFLDHSTKSITYDNFVNKELILFSMADNLRSIPSVIDGLKPGQRKVMYACFKRNLIKDTKVVELAGYVSENTAYHHGEASMHQTIIGLAQNFVGSNNVNCLEPSGSFGSRLAGGSDSASPRYIFTRLSPFARRVYSALDEPCYEHNTDDGRKIEPTMYCPVVPMVLLNGADGIGTGWSTSIPNYHPADVVNNLKRRMGRLESQDGVEAPFETMMPWFRGWKGTPEPAGPDRYRFDGIITQDGNEVTITELPIRVWTDDFKAKLEEIIKGEKVPSFIKDYKEFNDHKNVHFQIQLDEKHMKAALIDGLAERFKLHKTVATSNLVAFDQRGQIKKYEKVEDILEEYYEYRINMYTSRKAYWLAKLNTEYRKLKNQARFVTEIIDGELTVSKKKKPVLVAELRKRAYEAFPKASEAKKAGEDDDVVENTDEVADDEDSGARDYDYLLGLPIWSLTQERVDKLKQQMVGKKDEHDTLKKLSEKDLWCQDLDDFLVEWENQLREDADYDKSIRSTNRRHSRKIGAGGKSKKAASKKDDEYNPTKSKPQKSNAASLKPNPAKGTVKVEMKPNQRFLDMFSPKPKAKGQGSDGAAESDGGLSDDDFAALTSKPALKSKSTSRQPSEQPAVVTGRSKRAAAAAPKNWVVDDEESESDDGLGDIDNMVKGIGARDVSEDKPTNGRVSLFAMSRPDSSHIGRPTSSSGLPKPKAKASRTFDVSDEDETNYEMLARSSPHKSAPAPKDELDSFLSDDDDLPIIPKKAPVAKAAPKAVQKQKKVSPVISDDEDDDDLLIVSKTRAPKAVPKPKKAPAVVLSDDEEEEEPIVQKKPAAKAKKASVPISSDDDEDESIIPMKAAPKSKKASAPVFSDDDDESIIPQKAASKSKKAPVLSDDDEDEPIVPKKAAPKAAPKAAAKPVPKTKKAAAPKPVALSPAAKAYAAKQSKKAKEDYSDEEDEDVDMEDAEPSPPPRPAGRGRPARAAAVAKPKKPVYVDSEEDDLDMDDDDESAVVEDDESEDEF